MPMQNALRPPCGDIYDSEFYVSGLLIEQKPVHLPHIMAQFREFPARALRAAGITATRML